MSDSQGKNSVLQGHDKVLNSWKEISAYLNRGVRTVQRWEEFCGLPVRRPRGTHRSAVYALRSELDQWLESRPLKPGSVSLQRPLQWASRPYSDPGGARFLLIETECGLMFADLALTAGRDENEKIVRNLENARKAYQTVLRFRPRVNLNDSETVQLNRQLAKLKIVPQKLENQIAHSPV